VTESAAHYDTTRLPRVQREAANVHAQRQEDRVLALFRTFPDTTFTREAIEYQFEIPPQSASRVLANLTERAVIVKSLTATATSRYGKACHTWCLAKPRLTGEQGRLF
jgi:hypothetical protein